MKRLSIYLFCAILITIFGCDMLGGGDVAVVKGGILDLDKSLTVGKAFENYKYFTKSEWEAVKTDNGKRIVSVKSQFDIAKHPKLSDSLKSFEVQFQFVINQDKTLQVVWCGVAAETVKGEKITPQPTVDMNRCTNTLKGIYDNSPDL